MRAELSEHPGACVRDRAGSGIPHCRVQTARWSGMLRYLQVLPVAVVLWGLDAVDQLRAGAQVAGLRHAVAVAHISHHLGGAITQPMNHWLAANTVLAGVAVGYYIVLHGLIAGVVGLLLLWRRPGAFGFHRNALIAVNVIGLVVFWLYPVAPPRMLAGYHDVAAHAVPVFSSVIEGKAAGQFAALPSLHVAWAIWAAVVASTLLRRRALRAVVWLYPAATVVDVLATANHYVLNVLTAPGALLLAYLVAAALARARRHARRRPLAAGPRHHLPGGQPDIPRLLDVRPRGCEPAPWGRPASRRPRCKGTQPGACRVPGTARTACPGHLLSDRPRARPEGPAPGPRPLRNVGRRR
jgi:hypothetical protein